LTRAVDVQATRVGIKFEAAPPHEEEKKRKRKEILRAKNLWAAVDACPEEYLFRRLPFFISRLLLNGLSALMPEVSIPISRIR
jgi:hypothetical protein